MAVIDLFEAPLQGGQQAAVDFAPPLPVLAQKSTSSPVSTPVAGGTATLDSNGHLASSVYGTITTSSLFTSDAGTSLPDSLVWGASSFRIARPLTNAGSGAAGSANEWVGSFQADIPAATSSAANYEKAALTAFTRTKDPSNTATPITRDAVGADIRGWIDGGITTGRVWGAFIAGQVESGDGQVQGLEVDVVNKAAADVTTFSGNAVKCGISVVAAGTQNSTGAIHITAGAGVLWHKGIRFAPGAMGTGASDTLFELDNTFAIATDGKLKWGSGSAIDATLYRQAAADLRTDSLLESMRPTSGDFCFAGFVTGDTSARWIVDASGKTQWGGGASLDTDLFRSAAGVLKTTGTILHSSPEARVFNNANITGIVSGVNTALTFNSERFDTDTIHDTVSNTNRLTCKTAGKYLIGGCVEWDANATGVRDLSINHTSGVTTVAVAYEREEGLSANTLEQSICTLVDLAVNDYVELMVLQTSGVNRTINSIGNYTPEFWMVKVG